MKPAETWKPQRTLAVLLGIMAGLCVLILDIGSEKSLRVTLERAGMAIVVAMLSGYFCGVVLRFIFRELPEPAVTRFFGVPESLATQDEDDEQAASGEGPDATVDKEREGVMASESC